MLKYFSADWIFPVSSPPIKNGVVVVNPDGEIEEVLTKEEAGSLDLDIIAYKGAIVPGFINTHCHLELSHLLGQIPEQTGLVEFVQHIIKSRQGDIEEIKAAMYAAEKKMFENGIVAVGDISNQISSKEVKEQSKIYYHTFIEAMGFNPERADAIMDYVKGIKQAFGTLPNSIVPHAPYSVSPELFKLIKAEAEKDNIFISVHNQETDDENAFFENKTGEFLDLYQFLGLDISFFAPTKKTSLQTWLPYIKEQKTLLVHNTVSNKADIAFAKENNNNLYWCLCPQANLYIENALPDVDLLIEENVKITLGTDSLASNHQLNILSEMLTLQKCKQVSFEKLLSWATINGAEFLELDQQIGTIEIGKKPGLNLIQLSADFKIENDQVKRLI
ncbi:MULTISPECIES: amidohydrolase family protein [unclassified Pedobacter]|uniref:amidohydrolase family protein n=1 Tax=unclassified Pedobacter TaxID=2628915 RepID=UPI00141D7668|nr:MULTISPECIES: amidohydrolase family protein [unclassified Pedobacter]NII86016.1 cytosine/adenosine deaminase-related metal-dependent hydrolase [Pedobacter sp. SG908]NMN39072.1 cytosine/adenosine deaminase-related metal-dependent hydrolase [Pedobacter sp. SG918]